MVYLRIPVLWRCWISRALAGSGLQHATFTRVCTGRAACPSPHPFPTLSPCIATRTESPSMHSGACEGLSWRWARCCPRQAESPRQWPSLPVRASPAAWVSFTDAPNCQRPIDGGLGAFGCVCAAQSGFLPGVSPRPGCRGRSWAWGHRSRPADTWWKRHFLAHLTRGGGAPDARGRELQPAQARWAGGLAKPRPAVPRGECALMTHVRVSMGRRGNGARLGQACHHVSIA
jgi:hypothetical protein